jgi:hypothetical protein
VQWWQLDESGSLPGFLWCGVIAASAHELMRCARADGSEANGAKNVRLVLQNPSEYSSETGLSELKKHKPGTVTTRAEASVLPCFCMNIMYLADYACPTGRMLAVEFRLQDAHIPSCSSAFWGARRFLRAVCLMLRYSDHIVVHRSCTM